jgi:hypothetical protein
MKATGSASAYEIFTLSNSAVFYSLLVGFLDEVWLKCSVQ